MKHVSSRLDAIASLLIVIILVLLPFHAFLTVSLAGAFGHYTLLRLWKEILLVALTALALIALFRDRKLLETVRASRLNQCIAAYLAVEVAWGVIAYATHHVTLKALGYGWISDTRYIIFFIDVLIFAHLTPKLRHMWPRLLFWPLAIVCAFGLLQYFVLPYDFLKHFGYNANTIYPYETINHNLSYIRVMSTLRGANPLGAYMVLGTSLLLAYWRQWRKAWYILLGLASLLTLTLSFSRSAWIGLILSISTLLIIGVHASRFRRYIFPGLGVFVLVAIGSVLVLRHNVTFENAFFHTQDHSKVATSSNEGHASALKAGLKDIEHEPLGRGPGTAGPASPYNDGKTRIAENYFVQIGQETGWIGLVLFLAINYFLARELWQRRKDTLSLGLLAALIGLSFVNLLSHAWADDTLAYLFWGLAAMALGSGSMIKSGPKKKAA